MLEWWIHESMGMSYDEEWGNPQTEGWVEVTLYHPLH